MIFIDWAIVAILIVSSLISVRRGFSKEALSLASWVAALLVARVFSDNLASLLTPWLSNELYRYAAAFIILFLITLIVGALINHLLAEFVRMTGLTGTDRALGVIFGLLRGVIIVVVLLSLGKVFGFDQFWGNSVLVPYFDPVIKWTGENLHKVSSAILSVGGE